MNEAQRQILADVQTLFEQHSTEDALGLLVKHNDPVLWEVFREGVRYNRDFSYRGFHGKLELTGGKIMAWVEPTRRDLVTLYVARFTGLLDDVTEMAYDTGAPKDLSLFARLHLTRLCFWNVGFTDVSPLGQMPMLRDLEIIESSRLKDAEPFSSLRRLETLRLHDCAISDLSPLATMLQLRRLRVTVRFGRRTGHISDITPIRRLGGLVELQLSCAEGCRGLDDMRSFPHLQHLGLTGPGVCVIPDLSRHEELKGLCFYDAPLTDLTPLAGLTQLTFLDLQNVADVRTPLTEVTALAGLTKLEYLNLRGRLRLKDISPLAGMTAMRELWLTHCWQLTDLSPLQGMRDLESLRLTDCRKLTDLSPLRHMGRLKELRIEGCTQLTDLTPLAGLKSLERILAVDCTGLTDLSPLAGLTNLREATFYGCSGVTDFAPVQQLPNLEHLGV